MENNEILLELAQSIGQIVDKKVAEKTESVKPTLADAYKMVLEAIQNGTLENEEGQSVKELLTMVRMAYTCKYDEFVSDNKAEDDSCRLDSALKTVKDSIEDGEMYSEDIADILDAIGSESKYDDEVEDFVRKQADYFDVLVDKDDVDEEWIFDNVDSSIIRDVAIRYVDENL